MDHTLCPTIQVVLCQISVFFQELIFSPCNPILSELQRFTKIHRIYRNSYHEFQIGWNLLWISKYVDLIKNNLWIPVFTAAPSEKINRINWLPNAHALYFYITCLMGSTNQADQIFFLLQNFMNIDGTTLSFFVPFTVCRASET